MVNPECVETVKSFQKRLTQYKDDADEYILGKPEYSFDKLANFFLNDDAPL